MTYARFGTLLAGFSAAAALCAAAAHYFLEIDYALPFTVGTILMLFLLSLGMFWLGKRTATAENKFLFGNVFMGATVVKMFACGGLIAAYLFLFKPPTKLFVVPFFTSYFAFTVLEIIALVALAGAGKENAQSDA